MDNLLSSYLTHKDRSLILKSLSNINIEPMETDDSLISSVSLYMRDHPPVSRAEASYQQFAIDLINYLRLNPDDSNSDYVRRALKLLEQPESSPLFFNSPAIKAFVAGFTLHEISGNLTLRFTDEIQGLSPDEKQAAEDILLELASACPRDDAKLLEYTRHFVSSLGDNESTCLVNRFLRNIRKLVNVLSFDKKWSAEQRAWARGALKYIQMNEDVIADDLGIIGLIDDMYIAAVAVRFIDPVIQSIEEVIFDLYGAWSFLRDLVLTFKDSEYTYSEFALINTALICPALTTCGSLNRSALILPSSGITPFIVAFGAALGFAHDAARSISDSSSFTPGQKVRVDNEAVAIYDGVDEHDDQKYIRLKQYYRKGGQQLETIFRIPVEHIGRLCHASDDASTKGKIPTFVDDSLIPIGGTEALFHLPYAQSFSGLAGRVWLITQTSTARVLASEINLYGSPLSGVLPMGHVKRDGEIVRWDAKFGTTDCLLTVIADLDLAVELLEDQDLTADDLIVIDLNGPNRNKFASLSQTQSLPARVLCIAEEKDVDVITRLEENNYGLWEWAVDEIDGLDIADKPVSDSPHPFQHNDAVSFRSILLSPEIKVINSSEAENARKDLDALAQYVRKVGDDAPDEVNDILDELLGAFFMLIRAPVPLREMDGVSEGVTNNLERLFEKSRSSLYLGDAERELITQAISSIEYFSLNLEEDNLKTYAIQEILNNGTAAQIVTPPRSRIKECRIPSNSSLKSTIYLPWQEMHDSEHESLIVPYWPGRRHAWDIFSRPPSRNLYFILYSFEEEWYSAFSRARNIYRAKRDQHSNRAVIFTHKHKWNPPPTVVFSPPASIEPKDTLLEEEVSRFHQRLVHAAQKEGEISDTQARMIMFRGDAHAFFTPEHNAWSATHLLTDQADDTENEEKLRPVRIKDIAENDILVFLRGTDRDAIRELADASLPPGTRDTARMWQKSLRTYVNENRLSIRELQNLLADAGCQRHVATLRQWLDSESLIGPRNYANGDLEAIAEVTSDQILREKIDECASAISWVWGEHLRASSTIAKRVLNGIEGKITKGMNLESPLDIDDGLIVAQVDYIEVVDVTVPCSVVNRLRECA